MMTPLLTRNSTGARTTRTPSTIATMGQARSKREVNTVT
jgi:hypothetical protein